LYYVQLVYFIRDLSVWSHKITRLTQCYFSMTREQFDEDESLMTYIILWRSYIILIVDIEAIWTISSEVVGGVTNKSHFFLTIKLLTLSSYH